MAVEVLEPKLRELIGLDDLETAELTGGYELTLSQFCDYYFPENTYPPKRQMEKIIRFCNSVMSSDDVAYYLTAATVLPILNNRPPLRTEQISQKYFEDLASLEADSSGVNIFMQMTGGPIFVLYTGNDRNDEWIQNLEDTKESIIESLEDIADLHSGIRILGDKIELEQVKPEFFGLKTESRIFKILGENNEISIRSFGSEDTDTRQKTPFLIIEESTSDWWQKPAVDLTIAVENEADEENIQNYSPFRKLFTIRLKEWASLPDNYLYPFCNRDLITSQGRKDGQMVWLAEAEEPYAFISTKAVEYLNQPVEFKALKDRFLRRHHLEPTDSWIRLLELKDFIPHYYLELFTLIGKIMEVGLNGGTISDRTLVELNYEFSKLDELFKKELNVAIAPYFSPAEILIYELLWKGKEDTWQELDEFTLNLTRLADKSPRLFWRLARASGLHRVIPAFRHLEDVEGYEEKIAEAEAESINGLEVFCQAFDRTLFENSWYRKTDQESTLAYWSRITSLLPHFLIFRDYRPGTVQTEKYFHQLKVEKDFFQRIVEDLYPAPWMDFNRFILPDSSKGYIPYTAYVYSLRMNKLLEEFGSVEQQLILKWLEGKIAGQIILDAGVGPGNEFELLTKNGGIVYGIDASLNMVYEAQKKNPESEERIRKGDINNLSYEDGLFDIIICKYTLDELHDMSQAFREFHRILKPGGKLIYIVHDPMSQMASSKDPRNYLSREIVNVKLGENLVMAEPQKQYGLFFNRDFFELFDMKDFDQGQDPALRIHPNLNYPEFMAVLAIRRGEVKY